MTTGDPAKQSRALAAALEAVAGQVYFSPECRAAYESLGFAGSRGQFGGVAMPDGPAYFCSRGSLLGQVPGPVVAAAFGVFNPAVVVPAVSFGWGLTTAESIEAARTEGAVGQLARVLGEDPPEAKRLAEALGPVSESLPVAGRPLYAGLMERSVPDHPLGAAWRCADRLREYRGDSHISAWTAAGLDAVEIGLLTEVYWGLAPKTYIRTRAWSEEELDAGMERLASAGLVRDGALTDTGRGVREGIERATDRQCESVVAGVGDDFGEVGGLLCVGS